MNLRWYGRVERKSEVMLSRLDNIKELEVHKRFHPKRTGGIGMMFNKITKSKIKVGIGKSVD